MEVAGNLREALKHLGGVLLTNCHSPPVRGGARTLYSVQQDAHHLLIFSPNKKALSCGPSRKPESTARRGLMPLHFLRC